MIAYSMVGTKDLDAALRDIEDSLSFDTTVDSALVRGHILEAIRKQSTQQEPTE